MLRRTGTLGSAAVRFAVTDRRGGVSAPPYGELNLGDHVGDEPAAVAANRGRLAGALDLTSDRLAFMSQVHGRAVVVLETPPGLGRPVPVADALVTAVPGIALVVLVADCVPVLLASVDGAVVAAVHAGRSGVENGIVAAAVAAMAGLGARPDQMLAFVGPSVCAGCYPVPAELADRVVDAVPATRSRSASGGPALNLRAGVTSQLGAAGIDRVEVDTDCTVESPELYSHRRDRVTGRFAAVVLR